MNLKTGITSLVCLPGLLTLPLRAEHPASASPPTPKEIVNCGGGGWKDGQVNEPCLLVNPKDATKLILFYSGMKLGGSRGAIGKAWANTSEPFTWHEDAN